MSQNALPAGGAVLAAAMICAASTAAAQDQPASVDEIIVTAQKREQSLQDVPVVVMSVSGALAREAGVRDIRELSILTPGLTVTATSNETFVTARVRGVGTVGDNPGLESSVGVVIDGVYRPRNGVAFGDLGEVERIEVLKGPQGTLFGKNTSAGVINILTAQPTREVEAESEFTAGSHGQLGFTGSLSGPLAEGVQGRLFAAGRQREGFQDIVLGDGPRGEDTDNDQNFYTLRGQLAWQPAEGLDLRLIGDLTRRNEACCVGVQLFVGQSPAGRARMVEAVRPGSLDPTGTPFDRQGYADRSTDQRVADEGLSLEANWRLVPAITLTSITAWRDWKVEVGQDSDFTAADLVYRPDNGDNFTRFRQWSQELRAAGEAGPVSWLIGGFYAEEDLDTRSILRFGRDYYAYYAGRVLGGVPALIGLTPGTILQPGAGQDDRHSQANRTWALFTNNSLQIGEQFELTAGLRYTVDRKRVSSDYGTAGASCDQAEAGFGALTAALGAATANAIAGGLCINGQNNDFDDLGVVRQSRRESAWSGSLKAAWRPRAGMMAYASFARGYKAGGYNLDREGRVVATAAAPNWTADPDTRFAREMVDSWELGAKTAWLDRSLLVNLTAFHQTYEDFQLNTFAGTAFKVETLPKVTSRGLDADFVWLAPVDGLTLQGGITYADTEIGRFTAADLREPANFNSLRRLPGGRLSFAPLWSASLAGTYERDLGGLTLRSTLSGKFTSSYNTGSDLHPVKVQDDLLLLNARVGLGAPDESWRLELWSNNLTDQNYIQVGFNGPYQVNENDDSVSVYGAFLGAPRTTGVTLRLRR